MRDSFNHDPNSSPSPRAGRWRLVALTAGRALVVLAGSGAIGAAVHSARLRDGTLAAHVRHVPAPGRLRGFVTLDEAVAAFRRGDTLFVDSRSEASFQAAHIPGAVSLPFDKRDERLRVVRDWLPRDVPIIVYGQAGSFRQMYDVEDALVDAGLAPRLMRENFGIWRDRGLPVATGVERVWEGQ